MSETDVPIDSRLAVLRDENEELARELHGLRRFMDSMVRLMRAAESPRPESEALSLLEQVLDNALEAIGASDASLLAPDDATSELVFVLVRGENPQLELLGQRLPAGKGIASWVADNRRATIVNNAPIDDRFYPEVDLRLHYRTHSLLAAPLIGGGQVLGVVEVLNKHDGRLFSTGNQTLLTLMCRFAGELLYSMITEVDLTQTARRLRRGAPL